MNDGIDIANYPLYGVFELLQHIEEIWEGEGFLGRWKRDGFGRKVFHLELHTGGISGNEEIINSLFQKRDFKLLFYKKWECGGHHYFEINPAVVGFYSASELVGKLGVSRQAIHKNKGLERVMFYNRILYRERNSICLNKNATTQ